VRVNGPGAVSCPSVRVRSCGQGGRSREASVFEPQARWLNGRTGVSSKITILFYCIFAIFCYLPLVQVEIKEFPFVGSLPKKEKSKLVCLWESVTLFKDMIDQNGPPVSYALAAKLLGLSRQRVAQIVASGRLKIITSPDGKSVITGNSLVEFARQERKEGRPSLMSEKGFFSLASSVFKK
jgi:hypothetical protein